MPCNLTNTKTCSNFLKLVCHGMTYHLLSHHFSLSTLPFQMSSSTRSSIPVRDSAKIVPGKSNSVDEVDFKPRVHFRAIRGGNKNADDGSQSSASFGAQHDKL